MHRTKHQAYRSAYNETISSPKRGLQRVVRPPQEAIVESKRSQIIEDAEEDLELEMNKLEEDTHEYNLEIQRRIDAIKHNTALLEQRIEQEEQAMLESTESLRQGFTKRFQQEFVQFEQKMYAHWNRVESQQVAQQEKQFKDQEQQLHTFYHETVPAIMEKLQGTITRKLEKNHETFDIENAKIQKREKKTLATLETSEKNAAMWFATERDRKHIKFQEIDEALHHEMKLICRAKESEHTQIVATIASLREQFDAEQHVRNAEDLEILQQIAQGFQRLQTSIIENLGEQVDPDQPKRRRRKSSITAELAADSEQTASSSSLGDQASVTATTSDSAAAVPSASTDADASLPAAASSGAAGVVGNGGARTGAASRAVAKGK